MLTDAAGLRVSPRMWMLLAMRVAFAALVTYIATAGGWFSLAAFVLCLAHAARDWMFQVVTAMVVRDLLARLSDKEGHDELEVEGEPR